MKYRIELVGASLAVAAGLVGLLARYLNIPAEAYLPTAIGFLITASAILVKREIVSHLHLYRTAAEIEDTELRQHAMHQIQECAEKLESIKQGILRLSPEEFFRYIVDRMDGVRESVQAIHMALDLEAMLIWEEDPGVRNYYQANRRAVAKGVRIQRIFLLDPRVALHERANAVLSQQDRDGIEVLIKVVRAGEVEGIEEFMLYDRRDVQVNERLPAGRYTGVSIVKGARVASYEKRFLNLKASARAFAEVVPGESTIVTRPANTAAQPDSYAAG